MPVGVYVHGKASQNDIPKSQRDGPSNVRHSRQRIAEMARVDVPVIKLKSAPLPASENETVVLCEPSVAQTLNEELHEASGRTDARDMFDTDVEGIDDSTTTATSLVPGEDCGYRFQGISSNYHHSFNPDGAPLQLDRAPP